MKTIKIGLTLIAFFAFHQSFAQQRKTIKEFTINGQLNGKQIDSAVLNYLDPQGKYISNSVLVINQKFTLKGVIDEPTMAYISFKNTGESISPKKMMDRMLTFYLDQSVMTLTGDPALIKKIKISGSKTQEENDELQKELAVVNSETQLIMTEYNQEKDYNKKAVIKEKLEPFSKKSQNIAYHFFLSHPNSYVTADRVRYFVSRFELDTLKLLYNNFNDELKTSKGAQALKEEIRKLQAGSPGSLAVDFATADIDGKQLALSDFKGKYIILDFWASWCVPCRASNPHLLSLYNQYKDKGLEIIGISDDDSTIPDWKSAVIKDKIGVWKHVLRGLKKTSKGFDRTSDISEKYGVHSLPTKILVDRSGMIIGRFGGAIETEEAMDKKLAEIFK